jgi:signal peptidase II
MILIIVFSILSLDQISKYIITRNLQLNQSIPVISGIFNLTLVHNRGAAFGLLKNQLPVFIVTAIVAVVLMLFTLKNKKHKAIYAFALSLILAGALGNLIDRLFFGYVIDFLDFRIWPVFNIADSAITFGAIILGYSILTDKNAS